MGGWGNYFVRFGLHPGGLAAVWLAFLEAFGWLSIKAQASAACGDGPGSVCCGEEVGQARAWKGMCLPSLTRLPSASALRVKILIAVHRIAPV